MKPTMYITIITLVILLANFFLFAFNRLNVWIFWAVLIFAAIVAFLVVPRLRKRGL